ncbi:protein phosphatase 2C domain-containing protein [Candidatus Albibeggiatoa sp. nov. NOAA]|uniref:protein phosphatase 2C domain-containing protein n=1 Tax=Candidatus Albibeggiatoa sp. nov. NOAA TaxID=3162724 RepID=UPI003300EEAD|nr:protein phosphatase 2C domain-containing protein [Thiotrichaceae bacterium]
MLHLSSHYIIGATHSECQDFTLHSDVPIPHLVVCDGCSSSLGSHVGARILAKTAQYLLQQPTIPDYHDFGQYVINKGQRLVSQMELPNEVLDSTLLVAFVQNDIVTAYIYGDGCILYQKMEGTIGTINIEFADNAPYYLTYWLNEEHQAAYAMRGDDLMYIDDSLNPQFNPQSFRKPLIYHFPLAEYKTIALTSDGAISCVDVENSDKKTLAEVAPQLLQSDKPLDDNFVEQRILTMQQHYVEQQVHILDDLAVAMLTQAE